MEAFIRTPFAVVLLATLGMCYPSGAPVNACESLMPNHGATSQPADTSPYQIILNDFHNPMGVLQYVPEVTYTVTLKGNSSDDQFKGFLIQARIVGSSPERATGTFLPPTDTTEYQFHNCDSDNFPLTSGVTHINGDNKTNITFHWTASVETGTIQFAYTVVQTMHVFWTNLRTDEVTEKSCVPPEFLVTTYCSEVCPIGTFGNHTTGTCQNLPSSFGVITNASAFFVAFENDLQPGSVVLRYTILFDLSTIGEILGLFLSFSRTPLLESFFGFDNHLRTKDVIPVQGLRINSDNIAMLDEQLFLVNEIDERLFVNGTAKFDLDLSSVVVGENSLSALIFEYDSIVYFTVSNASKQDLCNNSPCINGGTCVSKVTSPNITCDCHPAYTGPICETLINHCALIPCQNGGTCESIGTTNYTCNCTSDFTGRNCETEINQCKMNSCQNNATCTDHLNGFYSCECASDFTGPNCSIPLFPCNDSACLNNGTCSISSRGNESFTCDCLAGFTGPLCEIDVNVCNNTVCMNGGTCMDLSGFLFTCMCLPGFTGSLCEIDIVYCTPHTCMNNGTCVEGAGNATFCVCLRGFTGDTCETDLNYCNTTTCMNNGTCVEGIGIQTSCECSDRFTGVSCEIALPSCSQKVCLNGGTCIEGIDTLVTCNCTDSYRGTFCETEVCFEDSCNFHGNCFETVGGLIRCNCTSGFSGNRCETDLSFCHPDSCNNGGICIEGEGTLITCNCTKGYVGVLCNEDDPNFQACTPLSCLNDGICVEEFGPSFSCNCQFGFNGTRCEADENFCQSSSCLNDGTCIEGLGNITSCQCSNGFSGDRCNNDDDFCGTNLARTCLNNGTCIEGYGNVTVCNCTDGFAGDTCEIDLPFCETVTCFNGGSCIEGFGTTTLCECVEGFSGDHCEKDDDFCETNPTHHCQNNSTCIEDVGALTACLCPIGFSGVDCGITTALNSSEDTTQDSCLSSFGITCETALITGSVVIAVGVICALMCLIFLFLLMALQCKRKKSYNVSGLQSSDILFMNPAHNSNLQGTGAKKNKKQGRSSVSDPLSIALASTY